MRRSLLNKLNTPKPLRQALVLLTILLLPSTARGQGEYYSLFVGGVRVSDTNASNILENNSGKVSYTHSTKTLKLENATFNGFIRYSGTEELTIEISGDNIITAQDSAAIRTPSQGTQSPLPNIKFKGSGTLKLTPSGSMSAITSFGNISFDGVNAWSTSGNYTNISNGNISGSLGENNVTIIICSGTPYGFYVGGKPVTNSNESSLLGNGVSFSPATTDAATLYLTNATITSDIEWDMNNDLTIQLTGGNTINGYISSKKNVALSFTYPSGNSNSYLTVGKSDNTGGAIRGFNTVTLASGLSYEEDAKYNASSKTLQNSLFSANIPLAHISYQYGLSIYKGNNVLMNFSSRKSSFSSNDNITGFSSGSISFDNSSKTLTLTGVTISDGIILWDHTGDNETLKITLSGNSTITCVTPMTITQEVGTQTADIKAPIISGAEVAYWKAYPPLSERENEPYLQFTSADQNERSLILSKSGTDDCIQGFKYINNSVVDGSVSHTKTADNGNNNASMLISSEFYGVWVNGDPVHGTSGYAKGYKENVTGKTNSESKPIVTFDSSKNILTLNGTYKEGEQYVTILTNGNNAIESNLEALTVHMVGENIIKCQGNSDYAFKGIKTGAKVTFTTDATSPGSLGCFAPEERMFDGITPEYQKGLSYQGGSNYNTISATDYGLTVAGVPVTSFNCGEIKGDNISGTVKFTPADATTSTPATLTLNGATLTNYINWETDADLTIELKGANSINSTDISCFVSSKERSISFTQGDTSNPCSLTLSSEDRVIGIGFSNYTTPIMGAGLYWFPTKDDKNIITSAIVKTLLSGGAGTDESPLLIKTYDDLKDFATYVNDGTLTTEYFRLDADIDCDGKTDFEPIGNDSHPFKGTFDGNENTIKNLQYSTESKTTPVGFFGTISGGTVKDLTLSNCSFSGGSSTGAIVGNFDSGTLSNNFYDADVTVTNGTTTKSGQTQRGIGNSDDVIGQVELAGTKKVTVKYESIVGNIKHEAVEGTYYTSIITNVNEKIDYYVLPGCNFTYSMKPKDGYKPRFALSDNTIEVTTVEKTENEAYDHTEFTFTMPNADLEVTWSYPIDLAAISADNFSIDDVNYTGEAIVPTIVKVTGVPGSVPSATRRLEKDRDFTIKGYKLNDESVDSPVDVGTYTVTIEGIDNYIGTQDVSYEIVKSYALKINGTQLNAKNIDDFYGNGTVKFTPATETEPTNTLTLNGASIYGAIESGLDDLTIHLTENNEIKATGNETALIVSTSTGALTFETDATSGGSLKFTDVDGVAFANPISGFSSAECLIVEGSLMTDDTTIAPTEENYIKYDSTDKVLTFKSYAGDLTSQVITGVTGLTVKLEGTSSITATSLDYPFKAMTNTATILFDGSDGGILNIKTNKTDGLFEGFADGAITYNKVAYWYDGSESNQVHRIQAPTAPALSVDADGKVKLAKDYLDGIIYYSIDYADDTEDLDNATYSEPFALTHPATVTAWAEANNATTSTITGKYFAFQDAPYSMVIGDTKTPTLLPAIAEGDALELSAYTSEDSDVATFADGLITAKNFGTAVLSVTLTAGDMTPFIVLNPVPDPNAPNEYAISFSVKVGAKLDNYFEAGNEYASYYNDADETYAVPDGMKAYVVTGVSGSKLMIEETTVMPPLTVVLLEKGTATLFTKTKAAGTAPAGNLLKHATSEVPATSESSLYVLYKDQYVKVTSGTQIPTGKNYLDLGTSASAGTRGFYNIVGGADDGSTGIREVKNGEVKSGEVKGEKWSDAWFDLQGRRLPSKPLKSGLYLHNGKMVVLHSK